MDNMKEMRNKVQDGKYNLTLEVAEGAYFGTYDDVDTKSGEDLVRNYLRSNSDDANFNDIKIKYNKNVTLNNIVDETILGGVLVKLGNEEIDGTVRTRLSKMKNQLSQVIS